MRSEGCFVAYMMYLYERCKLSTGILLNTPLITIKSSVFSSTKINLFHYRALCFSPLSLNDNNAYSNSRKPQKTVYHGGTKLWSCAHKCNSVIWTTKNWGYFKKLATLVVVSVSILCSENASAGSPGSAISNKTLTTEKTHKQHFPTELLNHF